MTSGRTAPRIAVVASVTSIVVAVAGFVVALILNAFVLDKFDAYGEVPIPGQGSVELPAGEVTISFHTLTTGSGGGLPVPSLRVQIIAPDGVADPILTENYGTTTTVNNDARVRVWVAQIAEPGIYEVRTDGEVNGYISPRLAFGHGSQFGWVVWVFVGLFVLGVIGLVASIWWLVRSGKRARPLGPQEYPSFTVAPPPPGPAGYVPTDQGIRLEQLKTLAALRDSGALTQEEFEAEKRRVLDS